MSLKNQFANYLPTLGGRMALQSGPFRSSATLGVYDPKGNGGAFGGAEERGVVPLEGGTVVA